MTNRIMHRYNELKRQGIRKDMIELGRQLWPDSSAESQQVNTHKLFSGKTKRFDFEWIPIICAFLETTPDELFRQE